MTMKQQKKELEDLEVPQRRVNMKHVIGDWYIDADRHQFIVKERSIIQDKESENYGEERFEVYGYCKTLEHALETIELINQRRIVETEDLDIKKALRKIQKNHNEIIKAIKEEK